MQLCAAPSRNDHHMRVYVNVDYSNVTSRAVVHALAHRCTSKHLIRGARPASDLERTDSLGALAPHKNIEKNRLARSLCGWSSPLRPAHSRMPVRARRGSRAGDPRPHFVTEATDLGSRKTRSTVRSAPLRRLRAVSSARVAPRLRRFAREKQRPKPRHMSGSQRCSGRKAEVYGDEQSVSARPRARSNPASSSAPRASVRVRAKCEAHGVGETMAHRRDRGVCGIRTRRGARRSRAARSALRVLQEPAADLRPAHASSRQLMPPWSARPHRRSWPRRWARDPARARRGRERA